MDPELLLMQEVDHLPAISLSLARAIVTLNLQYQALLLERMEAGELLTSHEARVEK
jgi:hypothetical protein